MLLLLNHCQHLYSTDTFNSHGKRPNYTNITTLISLLTKNLCLIFSGAPAGAEPRAELHTHRKWEIHQAKKIWWSPASVRTYARIRPGTSLYLSLIWSPSYAKSNTKTFFGLLS